MVNIRRLNEELQQAQQAIQLPIAFQELESLSLEPENLPIQTDLCLIWPGRIEVIYQAYLAEKTTWLAANPTVRLAQYRSKRGLPRWTKAVCNSEKWQLPRQCINLETKTLVEGPPGWLTGEIHAWLDWD
jgi:hypothetical protein